VTASGIPAWDAEFLLLVPLLPLPSWAAFFRGATGGRDRRAVKAYGLFPARVGLDPGDDEETDLLTLDATALIYALVNAVNELGRRWRHSRQW
jgi:hypothetical protein